MKQIICIALFIFLGLTSFSNDKKVAEIRGIFYALSLDSENTEKELAALREIKNPSGIIIAYEAAMEALMAKVEWNPFMKVSHVKESQEIFDRAIAVDPDNVEIRFLRFSVEWHLPKWLGLSKHMQDDKDFLMANLDGFDISCISDDMKNFITTFLNESGWFSEKELTGISAIFGK